jgi:hypothetical protein
MPDLEATVRRTPFLRRTRLAKSTPRNRVGSCSGAAFWKAVLSGDKADKTVEGWSKVIATLGPKVADILEWFLSSFR